jgi:glycosyltransferase involved in cell wall biosynthesis
MRVLLIHNHYKSTYIGGEDIVFEKELKLLQSTLGKENVFVYKRSNDSASVKDIATSILFSFKSYSEVLKIIRRENIKIMHVHNFFPLISMSVFLAAKKMKIKSVLTLHNFRPWCIAGTFYLAGKGICEKCSNKVFPIWGVKNRCFRKSYIQSLVAQVSFSTYKLFSFFDWIDYFVVLSPFQKNKVIELGINPNKVKLKANFVEDLRVKGNLQRDGYVFIGRPHEEKGLELILSAWSKVNQKLIIIGDMVGREDLLSKYQDDPNINFVGRKTQDEISRYLSSAKYLIQPSIWYETFGLTIVEAFRSGTPVIGFNIGTRKDFIKNEVNGFICEVSDFQDTLIKSIDFSQYDKLSKNARESYNEFSENKAQKNIMNLYEEILVR